MDPISIVFGATIGYVALSAASTKSKIAAELKKGIDDLAKFAISGNDENKDEKDKK